MEFFYKARFPGETSILLCEVRTDPPSTYRWTTNSKHFQSRNKFISETKLQFLSFQTLNSCFITQQQEFSLFITSGKFSNFNRQNVNLYQQAKTMNRDQRTGYLISPPHVYRS